MTWIAEPLATVHISAGALAQSTPSVNEVAVTGSAPEDHRVTHRHDQRHRAGDVPPVAGSVVTAPPVWGLASGEPPVLGVAMAPPVLAPAVPPPDAPPEPTGAPA
jgi:hypothetical protein